MNVPVCLIIFRRPAHTKKLIEALSEVRPNKLFVVADGPRPDVFDDMAACLSARKVIDDVDWPCDIHRFYSDVNLGCGKRPSSGIDWVFSHVDRAIILEDDCIPHPSFFSFCEEMLDRYADDIRVMHINGSNFSEVPLPVKSSYCFSKVISCWGWATWRRAWRYHDMAVSGWPILRRGRALKYAIGRSRMSKEFSAMLDLAHEGVGNVTYWDYQWALACWGHLGISILPKKNLISNCGCGNDATHTFNEKSSLASVPTMLMDNPLVHPEEIIVEYAADRYVMNKINNKGKKISIYSMAEKTLRKIFARIE